MSLAQLMTIVLARRRAALCLLGSLVLLVFVYSELQPRKYLANAAVMIDAHSTDPVAAPNTSSSTGSAGYMGTQIDLIQSERVAQRAIKILEIGNDPAQRQRWQKATEGRGSYESWLAEDLLANLELKPSRESNIVSIGYRSTDRDFAAAAANAFVRAYVDTTLELKVEPAKQYNAFFDERARQLRGSLEQAQTRLSAYQQSKGIIATDERLDVENARLAELSTQVVTLQDVSAGSASRKGQAGENSQEAVNNATVGSLSSALALQQAKLSELRQRLGDSNPQLIEQEASVAQIRSQLQAATRRVSISLGVNTSIDRARLASAQAALNEQREKVLRLRGQRDEASVLVRDVDNAQRAYDATLARVTQTNLESQNTFTNVSVVRTASPPPVATSPRPLLNTAVAFVVGSMLAVAFALVREFMDRRLRFDSDVTDALRQHLLVRIPRALVDATPSIGFDGRVARIIPSLPNAAP